MYISDVLKLLLQGELAKNILVKTEEEIELINIVDNHKCETSVQISSTRFSRKQNIRLHNPLYSF